MEEHLGGEKTSISSPPGGASCSKAKNETEILEAFERKESNLRSPSFRHSLEVIERGLEARRPFPREERTTSSVSIFRFPPSLVGIDQKAREPEIVSIGPYHRGKGDLLKFEDYKWSFLDNLLHRRSGFGRDLSFYLLKMRELETRTRECYSDATLMTSHEFVEMMLLDGVFVIELLRHIEGDASNKDNPILVRPWLIPILLKDLLKLENQLPFFVLESLFEDSLTEWDINRHLPHLAWRVFDLAFPMSKETIERCANGEFKHLLDLFYQGFLLFNHVSIPFDSENYHTSTHSIQCVSQLRPSGIKFKSRKSNSFLEIDFWSPVLQSPVLEIPAIAINDFTSTFIVNCVSLEQCLEDNRPKYFTAYASFMNCLINQPRDVAFLCSDGIITSFSGDDQYVVNFFNSIGKSVNFNLRDCYLSKQFNEVEAYYSSNWATLMRTYFSTPWSVIKVFSAFLLLALTATQTFMSIWSYEVLKR